MSLTLKIEEKCGEDHQQRPQGDAKADDGAIQPSTPPTSTGASCNGEEQSSLGSPLGKRGSRDDAEELTNAAAFSLTSYDSTFLEDLFEDVATVGPKSAPEDDVEPSTTTTTTTTYASITTASDFNLAKRRRVSTAKSLTMGRSRRSCNNLVSTITFPPSATTATSSSNQTTAAEHITDLPATVSASHSFQFEGNSTKAPGRTLCVQEIGSDPNETSKPDKHEEGFFGWFVDTDCDGHDHVSDAYSKESLSFLSVPLAFSIPTAPVAPSVDHLADVEWAQAADTIDEVLGDFF